MGAVFLDRINRIYRIVEEGFLTTDFYGLSAVILTQRAQRIREERKGFVFPLRQNLCELCVERVQAGRIYRIEGGAR